MFQYFLPGETEVTRQAVVSAGLGGVFRDIIANPVTLAKGITTRVVHGAGPGGNKGIVFAPANAGQQIGVSPGQKWIDCGEYWFTRSADVPDYDPTALQRPAGGGFTAGVNLVLGDGKVWEVPTIRAGGRMPALPRRMVFDESGEFGLSVLPEFDFAWVASGKIFDLVFGSQNVSWREAFSLCVDVLSLNYRIGEREAADLGLITTQNFQEIFKAAIDWDKIQELIGTDDVQKKTESAVEHASISHGDTVA